MDNERYAAVFKALLDNRGIPCQVGVTNDEVDGPVYVIECEAETGHKIDCCFTKNYPVLVTIPQIIQVPPMKRAQVLEACNKALQESLHTRFVITDEGYLESRSWSIFIAFESEDFTGDVAMEVIELYNEMSSVMSNCLPYILAAAR